MSRRSRAWRRNSKAGAACASVARWGSAIHRAVVTSQCRRRLVYAALHEGRVAPWDFEPAPDAAARYVRNEEPLGAADRRARLPRRPSPA